MRNFFNDWVDLVCWPADGPPKYACHWDMLERLVQVFRITRNTDHFELPIMEEIRRITVPDIIFTLMPVIGFSSDGRRVAVSANNSWRPGVYIAEVDLMQPEGADLDPVRGLLLFAEAPLFGTVKSILYNPDLNIVCRETSNGPISAMTINYAEGKITRNVRCEITPRAILLPSEMAPADKLSKRRIFEAIFRCYQGDGGQNECRFMGRYGVCSIRPDGTKSLAFFLCDLETGTIVPLIQLTDIGTCRYLFVFDVLESEILVLSIFNGENGSYIVQKFDIDAQLLFRRIPPVFPGYKWSQLKCEFPSYFPYVSVLSVKFSPQKLALVNCTKRFVEYFEFDHGRGCFELQRFLRTDCVSPYDLNRVLIAWLYHGMGNWFLKLPDSLSATLEEGCVSIVRERHKLSNAKLHELPTEIWEMIFGFLPLLDAVNLALAIPTTRLILQRFPATSQLVFDRFVMHYFLSYGLDETDSKLTEELESMTHWATIALRLQLQDTAKLYNAP